MGQRFSCLTRSRPLRCPGVETKYIVGLPFVCWSDTKLAGSGGQVCADFVSPKEWHHSHFTLDFDYEGPERGRCVSGHRPSLGVAHS